MPTHNYARAAAVETLDAYGQTYQRDRATLAATRDAAAEAVIEYVRGRVLTKREAARVLGIRRVTLDRWIAHVQDGSITVERGE